MARTGEKDSGISDLDSDFRPKRRSTTLSRQNKDDYTPIHNLSDLAPAIAIIKRGQDRTADAISMLHNMIQKEIKPKLDNVHDGFIRLETEQVKFDNELIDLKDTQRDVCEDIVTMRTGLASITTEHERTKEQVDKEVERIDGRSKTITGISATVILFVLGAVISSASAFYSVKSDVNSLTSDQVRIREEVAKMRVAHISTSSQVEVAAERVEAVAEKVVQVDSVNSLSNVWCDLSYRERLRQVKLRGVSQVPKRRCPR